MLLVTNNQVFDIPIVIFLYRRAHLVEGLITSLQMQKPKNIWLVADGPKSDSEIKLCEEARRAAEAAITWACDVRCLYAETNLGLKKRIESGMDEVFSQEEQAIILEEDCLPTADFFPFCEAMLKKYFRESKVGGVSGNCFLPKEQLLTTDYYYSRYLHIWGWATWARAWEKYDRKKWTWPDRGFCHFFPGAEADETQYWDRCFRRMQQGQLTSWAYGFMAWFWRSGWVGITPARNLVKNVGFGPGATNTRDVTVETGMERHGRLTPPYRGPGDIRADPVLDREVFQNHLLRQEGRLSFWPRIRRSLMKRIGY